MSVFAPFPLALASVLYGRTKGLLVGVVGLLICLAVSIYGFKDFTLFAYYLGVFVMGLGMAEIAKRQMNPVKGILIIGFSLYAIIGLSVYSIVSQSGMNLEEFIVSHIDKNSEILVTQKKVIQESQQKDAIEILKVLDNPALMAKELITALPGYLFIGIFISLWFNMFLILKSRRLLLSAETHEYTEKNLLNFKVPFGFVSLLVAGLVLVIWGTEMGWEHSEFVGFTILKCLGLFYFFQGFGVFSDLLNWLNVVGFFRTIIVMMVIFTAHYLIVVTGLFDNWFDFRKYFIKKIKE